MTSAGLSGGSDPDGHLGRGHSTIAITLDIYSHAIPAMQEEAAERVAALVFRPT